MQGLGVVEGFTRVEVPKFERRELDNCINYYIHEKWLNKGTQCMINFSVILSFYPLKVLLLGVDTGTFKLAKPKNSFGSLYRVHKYLGTSNLFKVPWSTVEVWLVLRLNYTI